MSINLATVDLSAANVGTTFTIPLQNVGIPPDIVNSRIPAYIRFFNDSCMALEGQTQKSGKQFYIPQGGWPLIQIRADETGINFNCTSQMLPVPSVCLLKPVYYLPGEEIDDPGTKGNAPQNIGGSVNVTSANNLSNEGNTIGTGPIIDIGPIGSPNLWNVFNDHFVISTLINGVAHQILKGQNALNNPPLQIGQAGDTTEVLGLVQVDDLIIPNKSATSINGSVSGSASLYAPVWGSIKIFILILSNYNSANSATFLFPSAANFGLIYAGPLGSGMTFGFFNGGNAAGCSITSSLGNTTTSGTSGGANSLHGDSLAQLVNTADRITLGSTASAAHTAAIIFAGV